MRPPRSSEGMRVGPRSEPLAFFPRALFATEFLRAAAAARPIGLPFSTQTGYCTFGIPNLGVAPFNCILVGRSRLKINRLLLVFCFHCPFLFYFIYLFIYFNYF